MSDWLAGRSERRWSLILSLLAMGVAVGAILWPQAPKPPKPAVGRHVPPKPKTTKPSPRTDRNQTAGKGYYVQLGAFRERARASRFAVKLKDWPHAIVRKPDGLYAVRVGPYATAPKARAAAAKLRRQFGAKGFLLKVGAD